jgi:hypothetical protein
VLQHYAMTTTAGVGPAIPKKLQTLSSDTWAKFEGAWLLAKTQTLEIESVSAIGAHHYSKATPPRTRGRMVLDGASHGQL